MKKIAIVLVAIIIVLAVGNYQFARHQKEQQVQSALDSATSDNGFTQLPYRIFNDGIVILAPTYCTSRQARDADALAAELKRRGVAHQRTNRFSLRIEADEMDDAKLEITNRLINLPPPLVIVNNSVSSNPDLEAVLAEFQRR